MWVIDLILEQRIYGPGHVHGPSETVLYPAQHFWGLEFDGDLRSRLGLTIGASGLRRLTTDQFSARQHKRLPVQRRRKTRASKNPTWRFQSGHNRTATFCIHERLGAFNFHSHAISHRAALSLEYGAGPADAHWVASARDRISKSKTAPARHFKFRSITSENVKIALRKIEGTVHNPLNWYPGPGHGVLNTDLWKSDRRYLESIQSLADGSNGWRISMS